MDRAMVSRPAQVLFCFNRFIKLLCVERRGVHSWAVSLTFGLIGFSNFAVSLELIPDCLGRDVRKEGWREPIELFPEVEQTPCLLRFGWTVLLRYGACE